MKELYDKVVNVSQYMYHEIILIMQNVFKIIFNEPVSFFGKSSPGDKYQIFYINKDHSL